MKTIHFIAFLSLWVFAAACASPTPAPVAATPTTQAATPAASAATPAPGVASPVSASATPSPAASAAPGEVVKLSGDTFLTSDPFRIDSDATLEITWNYTGTGPFALWLINMSEEVNDPRYDRMLITDVDGPPSGTAAQIVIPGDYVLQVEQADGPWTVNIKVSP